MAALSRQRGKNIGRVHRQEDSVSQGKRRTIIIKIIIVKAQVYMYIGNKAVISIWDVCNMYLYNYVITNTPLYTVGDIS